MGAPTPARTAALDVLRAIRAGALADRAMDSVAAHLDTRDRAWLQELVYGTLRLRARLDHLIAGHSNRPLDQLDPDVLDVLRLGTYQLVEMHGVPSYAAVSESVELARTAAGKGAGGFANAVLQSLRRAGGRSTFPALEADALAHLSTWGSHPEWLVARWLRQFGVAATARLVEANNTRPDLYLRVLGDIDQVRSLLAQHDVVAERVPDVPHVLRVISGSAHAALDSAPVIVQDPAAALVVDAAREPADIVLDLAAAPGGKAIALAYGAPADSSSHHTAPRFIAAADISTKRLRRLRANNDRLAQPQPAGTGYLPVRALVADARTPPFRAHSAGLVLLDAPCTGTGTLRRHPDGRWRVRDEDVASLVQLQRELLTAAAALVMQGGLLVYSTCSLEPEENEEQVQTFLRDHSDFMLEPITSTAATYVHADGTLRVLPHEHGFDGAFAARLRRS